MAGEPPQLLPRPQVPQPDRAVVPGRRRPVPVRGHRHTRHRVGVPDQPGQLRPGERVPHPHPDRHAPARQHGGAGRRDLRLHQSDVGAASVGVWHGQFPHGQPEGVQLPQRADPQLADHVRASAFILAEAYRRRWDAWNKDHKGDPPERNLRSESLAEVLRGNMYVQNHCYRADEMAQMIDLAHEFGFKIRSFHHAVESYKIADLLAKEGTSVSVWADWWGFKEEAMDGVQQNAALNQQAGGRPIIHSDDPGGIQRLNQEAAKAMYAGQRAGIPITRDQALRWITVNPAWAIGLDSIVGTLEPGKMADVVVWSGDPFSVYSKAVQVYNDGWLAYDRSDAAHQPRTDFELGEMPAPGSDR